QFILHDCPDKLSLVDSEFRRDKFKASDDGPVIKGSPKAFVECLQLMNKWSDGTEPSEWGPDTIMVIDSFSGLGTSAFNWAKGLNSSAKDPRQWYFVAQ